MTSSLGLQLTPGQRCLLDLLQRKLLNTIQSYARLSIEKQKSHQSNHEIDSELQRLKEKIRRVSARQKRFTLEIINGNGNNTIPKESFFEALGLVTKEALSKLNSKTNERRRRTTANPRFSHEAIQAKRALEPLQKRLEPRLRDSKREPSARRPQRHQPSSNNIQSNSNNNNNNGRTHNNTNGSLNNNNNSSTNNRGGNQQAPLNNNARTSSRATPSNRNNRNLMIHNERQELLVQFAQLQRQINSKVGKIKDKEESNRRLELQNELIRKRGIEIVSAINTLKPAPPNFQASGGGALEEDANNHHHHQQQPPSDQETNNKHTTSQNDDHDPSMHPTEPIDIWIDMKCDESIDGLD